MLGPPPSWVRRCSSSTFSSLTILAWFGSCIDSSFSVNRFVGRIVPILEVFDQLRHDTEELPIVVDQFIVLCLNDILGHWNTPSASPDCQFNRRSVFGQQKPAERTTSSKIISKMLRCWSTLQVTPMDGGWSSHSVAKAEISSVCWISLIGKV